VAAQGPRQGLRRGVVQVHGAGGGADGCGADGIRGIKSALGG
jgi:hypothetical protein